MILTPQISEMVIRPKIKSQYGEIPLEIPRDRNGDFEPQIVQKHQRDISGIEEKIISL